MSALVDDISSRDPVRVWSSACAIIKLRDAAELDVLASHFESIKSNAEGLALGGALFPNSEHLRFALRKIQYHRDGRGCLCLLYPEYLMYDPAKEQEAGNIQIDSTTRIDGKWIDFYSCTCKRCGVQFKVEEREYHYTWWGWHLISS